MILKSIKKNPFLLEWNPHVNLNLYKRSQHFQNILCSTEEKKHTEMKWVNYDRIVMFGLIILLIFF